MNTIPAQEIKRRGLAALDEAITKGDVHLIRNNQAQYVVISEARYQDLISAEQEVHYNRVQASLKDVKSGNITKFKTVDELLMALNGGNKIDNNQ
ncbi:MAG: hypothetical protein ACOH1I_04580 [Gallionellaceae bacterium]